MAKKQEQEELRRMELLQKALRCVLPPKRAEQACGALLASFHTFDGIFAAPPEVLREIPGLGEDGADFLQLVISLSQTYLEERTWNLQRVFDTASALELFRPKFLGRRAEAVCIMLLDSRGRMVYNDVICEGSFSEVPLHLRQVLQLCIAYQVDGVFLAHNHPSGMAAPSQNDLLVTDRLLVALQGINVALCDHIIFAGDGYYSFLESGVLGRQQSIVRTAQAEEVKQVQRLEAHLQGLESEHEQGGA